MISLLILLFLMKNNVMSAYQQPQHHITVDCAIFGYQDGELKLLLYPSAYEPFIGQWSLVGGFLNPDETIIEAAERVVLERLDVKHLFLKEVATFSDLQRDPVARVVSVMHYALVRQEEIDHKGLMKSGAKWFSIDALPEMILDYDKMFSVAFSQLQQEANDHLLGKELLPLKFTLLQLRQVYESIFRQDLEPANFRKKVMSLKVLVKHNEKSKTGSKKGAFYYSFNPMAEDRTLDRIVKLH